MRSYILIIASLALIVGCSSRGNTPITAKNLITSSSRVVSFSLDNASSINSIDSALADSTPTKAEISCPGKLPICQTIQNKLSARKVEIKQVFDDSNRLSLIYLKTSARNCPPQVFGCSVAANTLQEIPNYKQITSPSISSPASASYLADGYNKQNSEFTK